MGSVSTSLRLGVWGVVVVVAGCSTPATKIADKLSTKDSGLARQLRSADGGFAKNGDHLVAASWGKNADSIGARLSLSSTAAIEVAIGKHTDSPLRLVPIDARESAAHVDERGRVTYAGTHPNTDTFFVAKDKGLEWFMLLRRANDERRSFSWKVELPKQIANVKEEVGGTLGFDDASGYTLLRMSRPYAIDDTGARRAATLAYSDGVVTVALDTTGLKAPILLDPELGEAVWQQANQLQPSASNVFGLFYDSERRTSIALLSDGKDPLGWDGVQWKKFEEAKKVVAQNVGGGGKGEVLYPSTSGSWVFAADPSHKKAWVVTTDGTSNEAHLWSWMDFVWTDNGSTADLPLNDMTTRVMTALDESCVLLIGNGAGFGTRSYRWCVHGSPESDNPPFGPPAAIYNRQSKGDLFLVTVDGATWMGDGKGGWTNVATPPSGFGTNTLARVIFDQGGASDSKISILTLRPQGPSGTVLWNWDENAKNWAAVSSLSPTPRAKYSLSWDEQRKRIVLLGGTDATGARINDLWEWNGSVWISRQKNAPGGAGPLVFRPEQGASILTEAPTWDATHQLVASQWAWDGARWTRMPLTVAPKVGAAAYDTSRNIVVMTATDTTWESGSDLVWGSVPHGPTSFTTFDPHTMAYVPNLDSGGGGDMYYLANDGHRLTQYRLDLSNGWEEVAWDGYAPNNFALGAMVADTRRGVLVYFGGATPGNCFDEGEIEFKPGASWKNESSAPRPSPRYGHVMTYNESRGVVVLTGGIDCNTKAESHETWELSVSDHGRAWELVTDKGPSFTSTATMTFDASRGRVVVYDDGVVWEHYRRGNSCDDASQCDTGYCVDNVCCEVSACGTCETCGGDVRGVCTFVSAGNPDPDSCDAPGVCGGDGTCASPNGTGCALGSECASGFCVGAVCCDQACDGGCGQCGSGTCVPVAQGSIGSSCGDFVCDGQSASCPLSCTPRVDGTSIQCPSQIGGKRYCFDGHCSTRQPNGLLCSHGNGDECQSGNCVDGVCCNTDCSGGCDACNLPGKVGVCTVRPVGFVGAAPSCSPYLCNGASASCPTGCSADAQCATNNFCISGQCTSKWPNGHTCTALTAGQCNSGQCVDGVCCNSACNGGPCDVCNATGSVGTCSNLAPSQQDLRCTPALCSGTGAGCGTSCSGSGDCVPGAYCVNGQCNDRKPLAFTCTNDSECASGVCSDGVCCNEECDGAGNECRTCTMPGKVGSCQPMQAGSSGKGAGCGAYLCGGGGVCGQTCTDQGTVGLECIFGASCINHQCRTEHANGIACTDASECASGFCTDGVCCNTRCDGFECGSCANSAGICSFAPTSTAPRHDCGQYQCNGHNLDCPTTCVDDVDCVAGSICVVNAQHQRVCTNKFDLATACTNDTQCFSGHCADGVCCNTACNGESCSTCDGTGVGPAGECSPRDAHTAPRTVGAPSCGLNLCNGATTSCPNTCTGEDDCVDAAYCISGACTMQRPRGTECNVPSDCASNFCVNGVCCNSACNGNCQACDNTGAVGTCQPSPKGSDPVGCNSNPAAVCSGSSSSCPSGSCNAPTDCASGANCINGQCTFKKANGVGCNDSTVCDSGFCVDGVCCDTACNDGQCKSCTAIGSVGTCSFAPQGTPPKLINGLQDCTSPTVSGPAFVCSGSSVGCTGCTADNQCAAGGHCISGKCTFDLPNGQLCNNAGECNSGNCVDGVCCNSACTGSCQVCNAPTSLGTCSFAPPGSAARDGAPSCGDFVCSGSSSSCPTTCNGDDDCVDGGHCIQHSCTQKLPSGQACSAASQCYSGNCVDGVCCTTSCEGECKACNLGDPATGVIDGVCRVPVGKDPEGECGGKGSCAGSCQLDSKAPSGAKCEYPKADTRCDTCAVCDGKGQCSEMPPSGDDPACATVVCSAMSSECRTYKDLEASRCAFPSKCALPNDVLSCKVFEDVADGTACTGGACLGGACVALSTKSTDPGKTGGEENTNPTAGCAVDGHTSNDLVALWIVLALFALSARAPRRAELRQRAQSRPTKRPRR